jgi:hypothetical protein
MLYKVIISYCREQAIRIVCVYSLNYPAWKEQTHCYIVICGLSGCNILFRIILKNATIFGKIIGHKMCAFIFFTPFV